MNRMYRCSSDVRTYACRLLATLAAASCVCLAGCTGVGEDIKESVSDFLYKPDPLTEVKTAKAGDRKAKFLGQLQEPLQNGGSQQEQDEVVTLLIAHATEDPFPPCRLQAIYALGRFKDERAAPALEQAYYNASAFSPEIANLIRQQALRSLGETRTPRARDVLLRVAKARAREKNQFDQKLTQDERMAAIRALEEFRDPEVAAALAAIWKTEDDVALRERTRETFQIVTGGRTLPDDPQALDAVIQDPAQAPVATVSWTRSIRKAIGWP